MSVDPTAAAALRVPRSYADGLFVHGEQGPPTRVGAGTVVSIDSFNLATVLINDEQVTGVMWLGTVAPRVDDVVEVEMRGDLLVIPALNDIDTFLEGMADAAEHIVSDTDPGAPPARDLQIGGSMRGLDAWAFLGTDTANWLRELGGSGQGMRCYQTGQPTFVARNMATIPSGEAGIGPSDTGATWTTGETASGALSGVGLVETSTDRAYSSTIAIKATWTPDAKPSSVTLKVAGHTIGQQYSARVYVNVPAGGQDIRLSVLGVAGSAATSVKDTWVALSITYTATASEHVIGIATPAATATLAGGVYFDGFSVVAGATPLNPYFDGSTPSSAMEKYIWNGTPHLSTSEHWTGPNVPSVLLRGNLITNPSFETNTTGWGPIRCTITRTASATAKSGGFVARIVNDGANNTHYVIASPRLPVTGGQAYTFSLYARLVAGLGTGYTARIFWYDAGAVQIGGSVGGAAVNLSGDWAQLSVAGVAPAAAVTAGWHVQCPAGVATAADSWEIDGLLVEATTTTAPGSYFDGDSPDSEGQNYQWTGTAHASTSTLRTLPVGNPPGTTGILWSEEIFDVDPGDTIGFDAALFELANAPTAQLMVSYGSADDTFPPPEDPATLTVAMGAAVAIVGPDVIVARTTVVPDTATFPGPGVQEPKTARLGIKFTGNTPGTAQALVLKTTATLTPKGWPIGSLWMDPDAETGGLPTFNDTGPGGSTTATLANATVDTPVPAPAKKAIITAPPTTGGIAVVTFSGVIAFKDSTSVLYLKLVGAAGAVLAFVQMHSPAATQATTPFTLRCTVQLAADEEYTVTPMYAYSGTSTTTPHLALRLVTAVDFFPGAMRSGASSDPMIRYWDGDSWRPAKMNAATLDLSKDATTTPVSKTPTTTTLVRSPASLNEGATLTLTSTTTAGAAGTVTFYRSATTIGPWTSLGTATIAATKAVKTWEAVAGTWYFKAAYGGSATHGNSASAPSAATAVLRKVTKTLVIGCSWAQSYQGNGAQLSGTSADGAVQQGWASTEHGNRRALLRFVNTAIPAAAEVTSVSLVCKAGGWQHWASPSAPVLIVGSFNNTPTAPATYVSTDKYPDRSRIDIPTVFPSGGGDGGFTANISSWATVSVKSSLFSGILIGPGPSDSSAWWGYSAEPGKDQFTLKVVYDVYE